VNLSRRFAYGKVANFFAGKLLDTIGVVSNPDLGPLEDVNALEDALEEVNSLEQPEELFSWVSRYHVKAWMTLHLMCSEEQLHDLSKYDLPLEGFLWLPLKETSFDYGRISQLAPGSHD
jgi:hypothetical protein